MANEKPRRILMILGWVIAAILLLLYIGSKYQIIIFKRASPGEAITSTPPSGQPASKPTAAVKTGGSVARAEAPEARQLTTEELYQLASPSVVLVEVFDDEGHRRGIGSGFVASSDGSVITNYHVMRGAYRATAKFGDGTFAPVIGVVAYDPNHDVAVVKIELPSSPTIKLGNSDAVHVGQRVVAIGSPLGFQNTISEGLVSGLRGGLVQMSAPVSPGSSGGPVLNTAGEVVGVAVASITLAQNLNFAVPINWAKRYLGAGQPRSLAEVAAENTVLERILSGAVSVPAGQMRSWPIHFNSNYMSNAELHGQITSTGGFGGNITLSLYFGNQLVYNCPRQPRCEMHEDLSKDGVYTLVLDNRDSVMFARQVSGEIALHYVK